MNKQRLFSDFLTKLSQSFTMTIKMHTCKTNQLSQAQQGLEELEQDKHRHLHRHF